MSFQSEAQFLVVEDPHGEGMPMSLMPLEVSMEPGEMHRDEPLEVSAPQELEIVIDGLPGAPQDLEPLEVSSEEPSMTVEEEKKDDNDAAKKSPQDAKWDWSAHGPTGFIAWIKSRCDDVPKHSGNDTAGLERAVAYLDRLDGEISKAMRMDLDGALDADQIEKVRSTIDDGISRLHDRLDMVKKVKKNKRSKKKSSSEQNEAMVKEAQKIMGVGGVVVMADLLTSKIAKICINGVVSAGHDLSQTFHEQCKKYSLNKREQACVVELLDCLGYTMRYDRGYTWDEEVDPASSDNFDWSASYKG